VTALSPDRIVTVRQGGVAGGGDGDQRERRIAADHVLVGCSPQELARLLAAGGADDEFGAAAPDAEGAQVKVNMLLTRLPRLRDASVDPAAAFGGTFHINETWSQLQSAYDAAVEHRIPDPIPAEIYCHSLTDPSILSPELQAAGAQTLTVFALHTPDRLLTERTNDDMRARFERGVLDSLNSVLAEPIESLLMTDGEGNPCLETKTTRDLEHALRARAAEEDARRALPVDDRVHGERDPEQPRHREHDGAPHDEGVGVAVLRAMARDARRGRADQQADERHHAGRDRDAGLSEPEGGEGREHRDERGGRRRALPRQRGAIGRARALDEPGVGRGLAPIIRRRHQMPVSAW